VCLAPFFVEREESLARGLTVLLAVVLQCECRSAGILVSCGLSVWYLRVEKLLSCCLSRVLCVGLLRVRSKGCERVVPSLLSSG
jgi:hypothetical protein